MELEGNPELGACDFGLFLRFIVSQGNICELQIAVAVALMRTVQNCLVSTTLILSQQFFIDPEADRMIVVRICDVTQGLRPLL